MVINVHCMHSGFKQKVIDMLNLGVEIRINIYNSPYLKQNPILLFFIDLYVEIACFMQDDLMWNDCLIWGRIANFYKLKGNFVILRKFRGIFVIFIFF